MVLLPTAATVHICASVTFLCVSISFCFIPGTICDSDKDCGDDGCCVIEPTIDEYYGICKRKLAEYHQCSPVLFRKVWLGDKKPECGPCKKGLHCVEKG